MELYRVKELIELARIYTQIGYAVLDALIKAERELKYENISVITNI